MNSGEDKSERQGKDDPTTHETQSDNKNSAKEKSQTDGEAGSTTSSGGFLENIEGFVRDLSNALHGNAAKREAESEEEENLTSSKSKTDGATGSPSSSGGILENIGEFVKDLTSALHKKPSQALSELSLNGIADFIRSGKCQRIILMAGAGVSTSAGIPDFRSPTTGLYNNLAKYDLPCPEAIFDISFFKENPEPFFVLAKELYPGKFKPTPCHFFMRLLNEKNLLLRLYTQNVDTLEYVAGIPDEKIIAAHGSFRTGHCLKCGKKFSQDYMKEKLYAETIIKCDDCKGIVKPDIIFFGESLPMEFFTNSTQDFPNCDLLIILGTSLVVQPFASLVDRVNSDVPRLLINREKTGNRGSLERMLRMPGLDYEDEKNYRDVFWQGDCDSGCIELAKILGWEAELRSLIEAETKETETVSSL